jgi:hypothetical protein
MDLSYFNVIIQFFQNNVLAAVAAVLVICYLAYKETKFFFTMLLILIVLIGAISLITYVSDIGVSQKKTLIDKRTK